MILKKTFASFVIIIFILNSGYSVGKPSIQSKENTKQKLTAAALPEISNLKVTFIELGSVNCIPCRAMQPIMKEIEKEYAGQVKVVFHDVWTQKGQPYAKKYKIMAIPTQIFLDKNGKEFYRHIGFYPKKEIIKVLKTQGVK